MYVTYNNLFKLLIDKGLNKTEFAREVGISSNTLAKLSNSFRLRCSCASAASSTARLATSCRSRRAKRRSKAA